jgi:histidinol dehydrogenase
VKIKQLISTDPDFSKQLQSLLSRSNEKDTELSAIVSSILEDVRNRGDEALLEYTNKYDHRSVSKDDLEVIPSRLDEAVKQIPNELLQGLRTAADRIKEYHQHQRQESWRYIDRDGTTLGQQITPLDRVGVYIPGGKAAYPSSVLMNIIPAKVAGVREIIMVVPMSNNKLNPIVMAAASLTGVDRVFSIGGAQAIAALAFGTETIPQVDKIVGPGNQYVAAAKRLVYGTVGIDMIAGPSEVLVISDGKSNPDWVAMDLFAQAEHDEEACSILISPDGDFLKAVLCSIENLLPEMERADIIQSSIENNGALIHVDNMETAIDITNRIAPEHLELSVEDPESILPGIRHAGAIFMGRYTAEVLGDYCAGPNHVLPTSRTARFSSPLGVYDFQKRSSIIMCTEQSANGIAKTSSVLARGEGLIAHARSAEYRIKQ